jgi:beta-1,4-N-acetylglucosaminyltransferase
MCAIITASTTMRVLITVGSTRFDALVEAALSQPVLNALTQKGYSDVVVQCGNSQVDDAFSPTERKERNVRRYGVNIDVWRFKPSLDEEYDAADLVIGHAGLRSLYYRWP